MGTNYVPLICYYDGELQHSTGGPNYVGGHIRADRISKDISFVGFVTKMHELCKSPSGEAIIDVKCRYLIDQQTSIAMHVEDDTSLSVIMDSYPNQCNAIVVYIEKMPAEKSNTTSKSPRHDEGSSSFGDGQVNHMSDTAVEMNGNQYSSNDFDYSESLVIDLDHRESMESSTSTRPEDYSPYAHSSHPWQFLPNDHVRSTKSCLGMTICDPRDPYCQKWNKAFLISCMVALALDALFFYAPTIDGKRNCLGSDMRMELIVCVLRSVIDAVYVLHINFRFHTGFYDHTTDKIVVDRKEICKRYLSSFFLIDILAVLPLPQVLFLLVLPVMRGSINVSRRNSLRYAVLLQYFPRSLRIYPLYKLLREGNTMIKTAWAGAIFNFSLYMLASHIFGACWYFLSVQRETICWWQACSETTTCNHSSLYCGDSDAGQNAFLFATCQANTTVFDYGIYRDALQSGIVESSFLQKLIYCFWWGLQNLGSFGQNLKTSAYVWEVLFVVSTSLFGLFLFMLVIGNVQTYLRSDTVKTEIEIRKRLRDTEQWMSRYSVPENLKQRIRQNELSMRKRSRGLDDENILRHIPEDLKRDIKRHLRIGLLRRVPLVEIMDKKVVDALCDHLKYVFYTNGCIIMRAGEPVEELFFVLRGKLRCSTTISKRTGLSSQWHMRSGDFCGEELLTWAFTENSKPISTQNIQALDEVEGFVLKAYDLKCLVTEFDLLRNKDIQPILRFYSPEWRIWAAYYIQAAWSEYREMKLKEHLRVAPNDRSHIHELRGLMKKKPAKVPVKPQFHTAAD